LHSWFGHWNRNAKPVVAKKVTAKAKPVKKAPAKKTSEPQQAAA
jgi:hypothetical protein